MGVPAALKRRNEMTSLDEIRGDATFAVLVLHFSQACAVRRRGCSGVR